MIKPGSAALHQRVVDALRTVSDEIIVPRFNNLRKEDIRTKTHPADYVTIADEEAERALTPILRALVPQSRVIGEESVAADAQLMACLAEAEPVWIIDPIDGTTNFINGVARFAVMVALVQRCETVMGWIHEPLVGNTLAAEKGAGAWQTTAAGKTSRQHVPPPPSDLAQMTVALHHKAFAKLHGRFARNMRHGSAAHDYWAITEGRIQLLAYRRLKPWDHAAGALIHAEAGGYNRMLNGTAYRPGEPDQEGLLCAPSAEIWNEVAGMIESSAA